MEINLTSEVTPKLGPRDRFVKSIAAFAAAAALTAAPSTTLAKDDPLSAIGWLSRSVTSPTPTAAPKPAANEPPVASAGGALPSVVATTSLDGPSPDAIGLISPEVSGLPRDLWGAGLTEEVAAAVLKNRMDSLPALRQLFLTMLLAEAHPPIDSAGRGLLLQARIDKLILLGALEQAAALIEAAGTDTPQMFRRAFDVALLTGNENKACQKMQDAPGLAPTLQARVFCLARAGEWDAAALTLSTAGALDDLPDAQAQMLGRFLDPELFEHDPVPPPPNPVTPLDWKIYEAVGESLPTSGLPIAFAYAELSPNAGWKAQIEAAERLTRAGTIVPNVILGLYTERVPAASGGIWDRAKAFQSFDDAMVLGDVAKISQSLAPVWAKMQEVELEVPFALLYGRALSELPLEGEAAKIALRVALLSPDHARIAAAMPKMHEPATDFLLALASGRMDQAMAPDSLGRAILPAFKTPQISVEGQRLIEGKRLGEALLLAIEEIARGVEGDLTGVTQGLSLLRQLGMENVAKRTALELMILERRG